MGKKIVIVGGGIAGMSAGIFAQKYGFESVIVEKHAITGGQCAGWYREGCFIDGSLHWMTGTKEGTAYYRMWREIGALDDQTPMVRPPLFYKYSAPEGELVIWRDIERLKKEMLLLSPRDSREIKRFISIIKGGMAVDFPADRPLDMTNIFKKIRIGLGMTPAVRTLLFANNISCKEYSERFHHPLLKKFMTSLISGKQSLMQFVMSLAFFMSGNGDIPEGGSLALVQRIEKKYLSLGGVVRTRCEADEVIIKDDKATGLKLKSGEILPCDYIIMTCDARVTYHRLLKNKFNDGYFEARFNDEHSYPVNSAVQLAYSSDLGLDEYPENHIFETRPYSIAGREFTEGVLRIYKNAKSRNGKTTVISLLNQTGEDYVFWNALYTTEKSAYYTEKQRVADEVMARMIEYMPALEGHLKLIDVATPVTYERYCGSYKGSYMSFRMMPKKMPKTHKGYIKGLKNCMVSGQWLYSPGGLPIASSMGKYTVQRICKMEKIKL